MTTLPGSVRPAMSTMTLPVSSMPAPPLPQRSYSRASASPGSPVLASASTSLIAALTMRLGRVAPEGRGRAEPRAAAASMVLYIDRPSYFARTSGREGTPAYDGPVAGASRGFARALASIWFRSLQRDGVEPSSGATLFVLNHPNGLVDALVPAALLDRPPRFLGKATLWQILILKPLLAVFDPIPVHRKKDGDVGPEATARTFAAVHEAFARGEAVAMFPEGISHHLRDLAPLKTGAARI